MEGTIFKAMVVQEDDTGKFEISIKKKVIKDLPKADVLIRVKYSSLNYKDALSAIGNRGVTKKYPHTPGIDASGVVVESKVADFSPGDEVLVTGYDLGMNTCGGFEEYIRVPEEWIVRLPTGLTLGEAMIYGTAGFTAAMSVHALVAKVAPGDGPILVTGATGGVGCITVSILAKLGYSVTAVTGKPDGEKLLVRLGADKVIDRAGLSTSEKNPLVKAQWAGMIDTVGGEILANGIKATKSGGIVTCCGNVGSGNLNMTVYPFILRGVTLVGIDSQNCPHDLRCHIWNHLAGDWKISTMRDICEEIGLEGLSHHIGLILEGQQTGRVVVNLEA